MTTTTTAPARSNQRGWVIAAWTLLALGLIAALIFALIHWLPGLLKSDEDRRVDAQQCVSAYLIDQGFLAGEFTTDLSVADGDEVFESGDGQYRDEPVLSSEELESWLASDDARAQLAAARVNEAITGIVDLGWVGVKFLTPVTFVGNTGVVNGQVESFGNRASDPGEIFFYPVNLVTCQVIEGIVIRAGCANPGERVEPPCRETECLEPKNPDDDVTAPDGTVPLGPGPQTPNDLSEDQQADGDVSGNVIDNPVPGGTGAGDTTTELPSGTTTAPGAGSGGDNRANDTVDDTVTNQNPGGTNGDTEILPPPD